MYMQGHPQQKAQTTGSSTSSTQYVRLLAHIKSWLFTTAAWEDEDDVNGGNIREKTLCSQRSIKCMLA